jgi:hypothetical protein
MSNSEDFLKNMVTALGDSGIAYMVSGSVASSFHGQPRATNDVDIVIAPTEKQLESFLQSIAAEYYLSTNAARDALRHKSMFNVIDVESGWKADFIFRKDRAYSAQEFQRRRSVNMMDQNIFIVSAEDAILSKLEWTKGRLDSQQFRDAMGIAVVQWNDLDQGYLRKWAKQLDVENALDQLIEEVKKLKDSEPRQEFE